jgi:hypothetical protein
MSAANDRIRRELGCDLVQAGGDAGVNAPMERRGQTQQSDDDEIAQNLLYFTGFDQFEAWYDATNKKR